MAAFPKAIYVRAIEQKCIECIYDPHGNAGNWREQVGECTSYACPLYPVRAMPQGKKTVSVPFTLTQVKRDGETLLESRRNPCDSQK